ncbi:MAG: hypothetical protein KBS81_09500, partial [Spirochaetales bacterium]|nr:hypothetical protein [Candidatus Physcosoma equi]
MARERITDDYEDFEPEVMIWPYVALAFLLQAVPVLLSIALGGIFFLPLVLRAFYGLLPLLFTASIMREGERPWRLAIGGALYVLLELLLWVVFSLKDVEGYALGTPFGLLLSPSILSLAAYVFFLKRRRGNWIGTVLVSYILGIVYLFMILRYSDGGIYLVYPVLLLILTTFNLFVTRRTEGTPWFIALVLALLTVASAIFHPAVAAVFTHAPE